MSRIVTCIGLVLPSPLEKSKNSLAGRKNVQDHRIGSDNDQSETDPAAGSGACAWFAALGRLTKRNLKVAIILP